MKRLLSLFDYTGSWSLPFHEAGWDVVTVDIQDGTDINDFSCEFIIDNYLDGFDPFTGILAAPPCTDFTAAGARWWNDKDADGRTEAAAELVYQTIRTIEFVKPDFWALENPPGRIQKIVEILGPPVMHFHPWHFAGYANPDAVNSLRIQGLAESAALKATVEDWSAITPEEANATRLLNRYTKHTALWGHFPPLKKKPEPPVKVCRQGSWLQRLAGNAPDTKDLRSVTPDGFARAFFDAVKDYTLDWEAIDEGHAEYHSFQ